MRWTIMSTILFSILPSQDRGKVRGRPSQLGLIFQFQSHHFELILSLTSNATMYSTARLDHSTPSSTENKRPKGGPLTTALWKILTFLCFLDNCETECLYRPLIHFYTFFLHTAKFTTSNTRIESRSFIIL